MKNPSFDVAQKVGTIVLGQIVVDEVYNKYRENLEENNLWSHKRFYLKFFYDCFFLLARPYKIRITNGNAII